jgi:hypothetical protein
MNQLGMKARELLIGDGSFLQPVELLDLVGSAEADHASQLFARLLRLLTASFGHASRLGDHVYEYPEIGEHDKADHPDRLDPAGYVMTPQQVANQPKPERRRPGNCEK